MKYLIAISSIAIIMSIGCSDPKDKKETLESKVTSKDTLRTENAKASSKNDSWKIDASKSNVDYTVKNFGKKVDGKIGGLKGTIVFDKSHPEKAEFDASVKVSTIDTDNKKRDKDLMGGKYFDEPKHPEIIFRSKKISRKGDGYIAAGELSIKGKSHPVEMPFEFTESGHTGTFTSHFTINRHDYDIGGNGPILGDDIHVNLKVVAGKN